MSSVSVIVTTYHPGRQAGLDGIAKAWLKQPVEQVWILDGLGSYRPLPSFTEALTDKRFATFNLPFDLGNGADYCFALMTLGDHVILADDDMVPCAGFVERFLDFVGTADILGVIGRIFKGPQYRGDTLFVAGAKATEPTPVDFVGVCTFCRREHFGFDVRGLHPDLRNCDDLWWQMKERPELSKAVIPVGGLYRNLPTSSGADPSSMFRSGLDESRQDFYEKQYLAGNYYHAKKKREG
jgi:hypothetical protein